MRDLHSRKQAANFFFLAGNFFKSLDMRDLLSRIQALGTGISTVQYGVAAIELEFIVNGLQSLVSVLITTVAYPPATDKAE